jgi:hypothetical protein
MNNINTKDVSITTDRQIDYVAENVANITISPSEVPMIHGKESFLRFNVMLSGNAKAMLDDAAGGVSVLERVEIWDGNQQALIENVRDYAQLAATRHHYENTSSMDAMGQILEGYSPNDSLDSIYFDMPTSTGEMGQTLFKKVEIVVPLRMTSTLYQKVFPCVATRGLIVRLYFSRDIKAIRAYTATGFSSATDEAFALQVAVPTSATTEIKLSKLAAPSPNPVPAGQIRALANGSNVPYVVGSNIVFENTAGNPETAGVITAMSQDISSVILTVASFTPAVGGALNAKVWATTSNIDVKYTVSNMELIANVVQPQRGYYDSLMKKMKSDGGVVIDYNSWSQKLNNVNKNESTTSQLIDCVEARGCSIVNNFYDPNYSFSQNDMKPIIDNLQNYQFILNNVLTPNRKVDTSRFSTTGLDWNAVALGETTKALRRCFPVRTECENGKHFTLGRECAKQSYSCNLRDSDVRLNMFFLNPAVNKMLSSNIYHTRRLTITDNNIKVDF